MYNPEYVPVFAHRGASAYELENSLAAFTKARKLGADGIEIDVQLSKDGYPIVFHDQDLLRLAGRNKLVQDCTIDELQRFRIGRRFCRRFSKHRISTFEEVVMWANTNNMPLNIELKATLLENTDALISMLTNLTLPEGSHFSSFHYPLLEIVKKQAPQFETALIATKKLDWDSLSDLHVIDSVHAHKKYYKPRYLEASVRNGKRCRFYAIDGTEKFLTNPHPTVIGWITDYPDRVIAKQKRAE
ncbi:MAG: glycerophosphodiester phosphodiesterase family protein [Lysinibacillus sp.]